MQWRHFSTIMSSNNCHMELKNTSKHQARKEWFHTVHLSSQVEENCLTSSCTPEDSKNNLLAFTSYNWFKDSTIAIQADLSIEILSQIIFCWMMISTLRLQILDFQLQFGEEMDLEILWRSWVHLNTCLLSFCLDSLIMESQWIFLRLVWFCLLCSLASHHSIKLSQRIFTTNASQQTESTSSGTLTPKTSKKRQVFSQKTSKSSSKPWFNLTPPKDPQCLKSCLILGYKDLSQIL